MHLLDTSAVINLMYGSEKGNIIKKVVGSSPVAISALTVYELWIGMKPPEIDFFTNLIQEVTVIDFNKLSAIKSADLETELKKKGIMINKVDLLIAGTCLAHGFELVTCDADFSKVKGLTVHQC